ncbi:MAG: EAL domain-containing protein [Gammaproteobacteria bacterium]|nr:EAL domain-containing protein [Gammaproteobacteria bacterium]
MPAGGEITLLLTTVLIVVLVFASVLVWKRKRARARLAHLSREVDEIARDELFHERVSLSDDEDDLAALEGSINRVLELAHANERKLRRQDLLFHNLADNLDQAILVHRQEILFANSGFAALTGTRQADIVGQDFVNLLHPDYRQLVADAMQGWLKGEPQAEPMDVQILDRHGNGVWARMSSKPTEFREKKALLTSIQNISTEKAMRDALEHGKLQTRVTLESISEGVVTTDCNGNIDYMNSAAEYLIGVRSADALGRNFASMVSLVDEFDGKPIADPVAIALDKGQRVSVGRRALLASTAKDEEFSVDLNASPIRDISGATIGAVVVLHDVTEIRGLTRQMSYQASHDALTGLINRREFERRLNETLSDARTKNNSHVLCYLDLDRFKAVNDTCGHTAGDNLLREVAGIVRDKVRDSDLVGRLGGDEFGMILLGCPLDKARQISDDVVKAVRDYRFVWRDRIFNIGVSVGMVEITHESGSLEDLVSAADSACYIAKQQGRGRVHVYSARDEAVARHRGEIMWLQRLQAALRENRFDLHVQPIVSTGGRAIPGPAMEILLRMRDDAGKEILPGEFMGAAERYHLMPYVDRWVVQTALAALGRETIRLPAHRSCAINLSGQTLADDTFLEFVVESLDRSGVAPASICFEVSEGAVVANLKQAHRFIRVLHGMGCKFALDDFGSGIGSLANLKNLAIDYLKIDGSFVRSLSEDYANQALVSAMVKLGESLNFKIIAEEVEDDVSFEAVKALGVDFVQGYAIGYPRSLYPQDAMSA